MIAEQVTGGLRRADERRVRMVLYDVIHGGAMSALPAESLVLRAGEWLQTPLRPIQHLRDTLANSMHREVFG